MDFIEKHKALLITALISGTLVLVMFAVGIKKHTEVLAESYYEMPPPLTPEERKILEEIAMSEATSPETNKAFNSSKEFQEVMKNFKSVSPDDFNKHAKQTETEVVEMLEEASEVENNNTAEEYSVNENELSSYSKINKVIAMRSAAKRKASQSNGDNSTNKLAANAKVNTNSSVSYSLVNRTDKFLPPPVYLCEEGGKIVINITVNSEGEVIDTYVNNSSTSKNACLIDSALQYANDARFNADASKEKQIGSITYYFKGKS